MRSEFIKIGEREPEVYIKAALTMLKYNSKVTFTYVDSRKGNAKLVIDMMEGGGFVVGRTTKQRKDYDKYVYEFDGGKSIDGKPGVVKYYPKDKNLKINGKLKPEFEKDILKLVIECGKRIEMRVDFYYVEVWKRII